MNITLKEYIEQNNINKNIAVLLLKKGGKTISVEYTPKEFNVMSECLLNMEVMDVVDEDDAIEIWVM